MAAIRGKQSVGEIMRYIDRVSGSEERYDLFCEAGLWKKALDEGFKMRDTRRIASIKSLCDKPEVRLLCDEMMGRLASA
jgi:hypothetical protein